MRITAIVLLSVFSVLAHAGDNGVLTGARYENKPYSLTIDVPGGWQSASAASHDAIRKAIAPPESLWLLIEAAPGSPTPAVITIKAQELDKTFGISADVGKLYLENAGKNPANTVLRAPFLILLGGLDVYRTDLKRSANGQESYFALLALGVKDRILVFQVRGASQDVIDEGVRMLLKSVQFTPAWSLPDDQIGPISTRVKISSSNAEGRLLKKVQPEYPALAKARHISGRVVLSVSISPQGLIRRIWILEGDPLLAESTVKAVSQWTYEPYLLKGEPVTVETKVFVDYNLRR